jgi:Protein of unknown function (DUF3800)
MLVDMARPVWSSQFQQIYRTAGWITPHMLVFIDESGDPGFKLHKGSSPIFVAAMVIFENSEDAKATESIIRLAMQRMSVSPEFKFNKSKDQIRDDFFHSVRNCPFTVRAIVVRKDLIRSTNLKTKKETFYQYFVRSMMENDNGILDGAKVIIDGSGDREFKQKLKSNMKRNLGGRLSEIRFSNSESDVLVQLADMCAGAIARSYRPDRPNRWRWRKMLASRINDVWDFS